MHTHLFIAIACVSLHMDVTNMPQYHLYHNNVYQDLLYQTDLFNMCADHTCRSKTLIKQHDLAS